MSVEAITWALKQPIRQSSAKFVLVVLANCASGDTFLAFPSTAYICEATGQDRKTVMANLAKLREWGLVEDTGKRSGVTKQIVVYRVTCAPDLLSKEAQKRNSTGNGTVPKTDGNSPVFPRKEAQKRDTEPSVTVSKQKPKADAPSANRGCRLPADWNPSPDDIAFVAEKHPGVNWIAEAEKFRDYWAAQPASKGVKADWPATWRNWIRNARAGPPGAPPTAGKPSAAANFRGKTYEPTSIDQLPADLRAAAIAACGNG